MKTLLETLESNVEYDEYGHIVWKIDNVLKAMKEYSDQGKDEILSVFIKAWKEEFPEQNWEYLDFVKDRILNNDCL